jgi:hypothetical protein
LSLRGIFTKYIKNMDFETVKLILESMRKELPNREAYLIHLKELTEQQRKNVNSSIISKEINEINEFINSEVLTDVEKEEFLVVKQQLQIILKSKK